MRRSKLGPLNEIQIVYSGSILLLNGLTTKIRLFIIIYQTENPLDAESPILVSKTRGAANLSAY